MLSASPLAQDLNAVSLLGVDYFHLKTADGSELYLTRFGAPFREQLLPENWYEPEWFAAERTRLVGTSTIYRLPSKPVRGVSLDLVVRFSRVGEEVPMDAESRNRNIDVEFNSPFEEFAAVMQLRAMRPRIFTKKPLAIFIPGERLQLWQTGRLESKIATKLARHPEVPLDILRQYILLYGWIKGVNAVQAVQAVGAGAYPSHNFLSEITLKAISDLARHRFWMLDMKPEHIVLRICRDGSLLRGKGSLCYALVDYELLEGF